MIRPIAALAVFALCTGVSFAQEAAPAAAPAAVPADIVVDPTANVSASPKQANMLTGFYATQAVIEICGVTLSPEVISGMSADRERLESSLGMDTPTAEEAYAKVKADVVKTDPDCAETSSDRKSVDAVTAIYKAQAATVDAAKAAAPAAPATPAAPAEPATPAVPAQ